MGAFLLLEVARKGSLYLFIIKSNMRIHLTAGLLVLVSWGAFAYPQGQYGAPKCEKKRVEQPISYDCTQDQECTTKYEDKCETKYEQECETKYEKCEVEYQDKCETKYEEQCEV